MPQPRRDAQWLAEEPHRVDPVGGTEVYPVVAEGGAAAGRALGQRVDPPHCRQRAVEHHRGRTGHGDDGGLDIDRAALGDEIEGDIVAEGVDLDLGERGCAHHLAGGLDADDLDQLVLQVDGQFVRFVEGEALARAVEQRALDDHIGAVDKALALGEREREKGQGRCGVVEAQPDLLCGKDLAEIDLEPPVLYGGARRRSPAGSGVAVEGTEGGCRRGARTAHGSVGERVDILGDENRAQRAAFLELYRACGIGPGLPDVGRGEGEALGPGRGYGREAERQSQKTS